MSPLRVVLSFLLLLFTFTTAVPHDSLVARGPPEVAGPHRRGVIYNQAKYVKFFDYPQSQVTWTYNWDSRTDPTNIWYEFVPMLHSLTGNHPFLWEANVKEVALQNPDLPTHVLGFNEPDNCDTRFQLVTDMRGSGAGGSCMSVSEAVSNWTVWMQPQLKWKQKMYLGSPAVSNGPNGLPWLEKFLKDCTGCTIDFINIHWFDSAVNAAYFKQHIEDARRIAAGRPIWVTEFKARGTDEEVMAFLDEVLPWMDASTDIHRYAYYMAANGEGLLIEDNLQNHRLSDIGWKYATRA